MSVNAAGHRREYAPIVPIALVVLGTHLATNFAGGYGYFRDEFYYVACSEHLDWGYVDHPPLSILLLRLNRFLLGDSIFALRLLPALSAAALVVLTGWIVREFGGGRMARLLACLAVAVAPVYLGVNSFFSMNAFEPLFWTGTAGLLMRIVTTGEKRLWLPVGLLVGAGLQNKLGMLFFAAALLAGLLLTPRRNLLTGRWFWTGVAAAAVLFLPNVLWQAANGLPTLEFMRNAQQWKNAPLSPGAFLSAQVLFQHPFAAPLWIGGLLALVFRKELAQHRYFGLAFLLLLLLFLLQRGKPYYLSPAYPGILAAGGVLFERILERTGRRWAGTVYAGLLAVGGLATLPLGLPVLPPASYVQYAGLLGLHTPAMERHGDTALPQVFADRFGWEEMVATVARVYRSLPPEERAGAAIFTQNYGEAGAVDFFGARYGLPRAISGHNNYWLWGPRGHSGDVVIIVGGRREEYERVFDSVELGATHTHPLAMPSETDLPVFLCTKPRVPLNEVWPLVKRFI